MIPDIIFSLLIDNILDEQIVYSEINRKNINSIPIYLERSVYAKLEINF